jgi:hypothetical protein
MGVQRVPGFYDRHPGARAVGGADRFHPALTNNKKSFILARGILFFILFL